MPVEAIIPPDETIAGGVVYLGNTWTVTHNQLTGNTEGKRRKMIELLQGAVFDRVVNVDDLDPADPDHPDNNSWNVYGDQFRRPDDSLIDEHSFVYQQNPATVFRVERNVLCDIILAVANDPALGGNDRYALVLSGGL